MPPKKNLLICSGKIKLMDMKTDFSAVDWDNVSEEDGFYRYKDTLRQSVNYSLHTHEGETAYAIALSSEYELSRLLKEDGRNSVICGECADQIFHQHTYADKERVPFVYSYGEDSFEMAYYVVLKKSIYMLQSFGLEGYYPFLEREMIQDCLKAAEKSRFFDDDYRLTQKYGIKESIRDYYLSLCYLESFEKQFCD